MAVHEVNLQTPLYGQSIMSVPTMATTYNDSVAAELSGVEINQNGVISGQFPLNDETMVWQTFRFSGDFPRGVTGGSVRIPMLSGFQVNVEVEEGKGSAAAIDWFIDYYDPFRGWTGVAKGTEVGSAGEGDVWYSVNFKPVDITNYWWRKFRLGIRGRGEGGVYREPVPYAREENLITIRNQVFEVIPTISAAPLIEGGKYPFDFEGIPSLIEIVGGDAYFTEQQGIRGIHYTSPNPFSETVSTEYVSITAEADSAANGEFAAIEASIPLAVRKSEQTGIVTVPRLVGADIKAYESDGVTPIFQQVGESAGEEVSLRFRILSTAPDTDTDCTGSTYRTVAMVSAPENVRSSNGDLANSYWLSGPNPSQFACEALYLDISEGGEATVADRLVVDPITPGVFMNVYWSNDESTPHSTEEWDGLLWTPIPKQFLLRRKESFALPEPLTAKYVKLEFTRLQPVWYSAGTFQKATQYRKHPSWVWNYYLCLYEEIRAAQVEASAVTVSYDALDLAYNYYLEDIRQDDPDSPTTITSAEGVSLLTNALTKAEEEEEKTVDASTLARINLSMQRFRQQPSAQGSFTSLLQRVASGSSEPNNYPTEGIVTTVANTSQVSGVERDNVIVEKSFPVTQFYLPCRHYYAVAESEFEEERAYFVGLKEVAFTRDHYETRYDNELYIETVGDDLNIESNDLYSSDHTWTTFHEIEEGSVHAEELEPSESLEPEETLEPY